MDLADYINLNKQVALKVVTLHKIKDPYVSKNLKREPAMLVSLKEVVSVGGFYCLSAWSTISTLDGDDTIGSERIDASSCLKRQAGGSSTMVIISLTTMAMMRSQ